MESSYPQNQKPTLWVCSTSTGILERIFSDSSVAHPLCGLKPQQRENALAYLANVPDLGLYILDVLNFKHFLGPWEAFLVVPGRQLFTRKLLDGGTCNLFGVHRRIGGHYSRPRKWDKP